MIIICVADFAQKINAIFSLIIGNRGPLWLTRMEGYILKFLKSFGEFLLWGHSFTIVKCHWEEVFPKIGKWLTPKMKDRKVISTHHMKYINRGKISH